MKTRTPTIIAAGICALVLTTASGFSQGSLTPPGAPAPTMKTLDQIEPRTPISSLPYTITRPGAYFITTNLTGVANANGITIATGNVALDLRGFTLTGVPGSTNGIYVAGNYTEITIENGTVTTWGLMGVNADNAIGGRFTRLNIVANTDDGLDPGGSAQVSDCVSHDNIGNGFGGLCYRSTFEHCAAHDNHLVGFSTFDQCLFIVCSATVNGTDGFNPFYNCTLKDCVATQNGFDGIDSPWSGCLFAHCIVDNNGVLGLLSGDDCTISGCTVAYSGSDGITAGSGSTIESSTTGFNQGDGINAENNCNIIGCTSRTNSGASSVGIIAGNGCSIKDCVAAANSLNGIVVSNACFLEQNVCQSNGGGGTTDGGIRCLGSKNRVDDNHLTDNNANGLYLDGSGNTIVRNTAKGNLTSNYSTGSGNDVGPIGSAATSTSPWANLQ